MDDDLSTMGVSHPHHLTIEEVYRLGSQKNQSNTSEELKTGLERVYNSTPLGPLPSNLVSTVYGINHRQTQLALPFNKDQYGLTFFTRPRMNLTTENLIHVRQFFPLLTGDERSVQRVIRCYLDPQLEYPVDPSIKPVTCPYVDTLNVFIPMLTNLCTTVSGWPDFSVDTKDTPEGAYKETHSMVDSTIEIRNSYELSIGFRNIPNNPITLFHYFWILYASKVFEGELIPYGSSLFFNEIDYNTRIYRLILDPGKRYVQHILSSGVSFPINSPVGAIGNFDTSQPYNDANDNVSIRYKCIGMDYNDPIQVLEFNRAVTVMNPAMHDSVRIGHYVKIPYQILSFFNMRGYPRINPDTMELEWYVPIRLAEMYISQMNEYTDLTGLTNKTFLDKLKARDFAGYRTSLVEMDKVEKDVMSGGVIENRQDQISRADWERLQESLGESRKQENNRNYY